MDNYARWLARERELTAWLNKLPTCERCGQAIQQERAVCIDGFWYCDDCIEFYRKEIEAE